MSACGGASTQPDPDAGGIDAGEIDAGEIDAGEVDASGIDAGEIDAGTRTCLSESECDDGSACTSDSCSAGICQHIDISGECDDGVTCTADTCDALTGCGHAPDGALCDDGVACTVDTCSAAAGCEHAPTDSLCNDAVGCTVDTCDVALGCSFTPEHTACDDGIDCTEDSCSGTTDCVNAADDSYCDDGIACTTSFCSAANDCVTTTDDAACDDMLECTAELCSPSVGCESSDVMQSVSCYSGRGSCDGVGACSTQLSAPFRVTSIDDFTRFGYSVAFRYYEGVVGGPNDAGTGLGAAFVVNASHPTGANSVYTIGQALVPTLARTSGYGQSVATHGSAHYVSDPRATVAASAQAGVVHVFRQPAATWVADQVLTSPSPGASQLFGFSVTASNDLVLVREFTGSLAARVARLHVYRCTTTCSFVQTIAGSNAQFGVVAAILLPNRIAIGDPSSGTGQVHLYESNPNTGIFARYDTLFAPGPRTGSLGFGEAVAATGNHVFVGEDGYDVPGESNGAVHVYSATQAAPSTFAFAHSLFAAGSAQGFGTSLHAVELANTVRLAVASRPGSTAHVHLFVGSRLPSATPFHEVLAVYRPSSDSSSDFGRSLVLTQQGDLLAGAPEAFVAAGTVYGALYSHEWP